MKHLLILIISFFSAALLQAQILNAGFENWTNNEPDNWFTNNVPGAWVTVSSSTTSFTGVNAAKIEIADFNNAPMFPVLSTILPVTEYHSNLQGYYQFHKTIEEAEFYILVYAFKDQTYIGEGALEIESSAISYTEFNVDITTANQIPDSIMIQFQVVSNSDTETGIGTYALIDQLSFSQTTSVNRIDHNPVGFSLQQNYPNPFNPSTVISWQSPVSGHQILKVFDVLGNEVATLVDGLKDAGYYETEFNASELPSGLYFYQLRSNSFSITKKMMLIK